MGLAHMHLALNRTHFEIQGYGAVLFIDKGRGCARPPLVFLVFNGQLVPNTHSIFRSLCARFWKRYQLFNGVARRWLNPLEKRLDSSFVFLR